MRHMTDAASAADANELARECARAMFDADAASRALGMEMVDAAAGRATVRMTITARMLNGHRIGHGGYTFMLAGNAADNAARAAAIGQDVTAAAKDDLPAAWAQNVEASTASQDGMVKATVRLKVPVLFPGGVDFPYHVTGEAGAAREVAP